MTRRSRRGWGGRGDGICHILPSGQEDDECAGAEPAEEFACARVRSCCSYWARKMMPVVGIAPIWRPGVICNLPAQVSGTGKGEGAKSINRPPPQQPATMNPEQKEQVAREMFGKGFEVSGGLGPAKTDDDYIRSCYTRPPLLHTPPTPPPLAPALNRSCPRTRKKR